MDTREVVIDDDDPTRVRGVLDRDDSPPTGDPADATPPARDTGPWNKSMALEPGSQIGRYLVLECIGAGGVAEVYRAYDAKLSREVAVKLLRAHRRDVRSSPARSRDEIRMLREAQAMAQLSHPNLLPVFDVEATEYGFALAMEFVPGQSLHQWLRAQPRSWRDVVFMFVQAGRGLAAAHVAGVIHRDFKPANVMIDTRDHRARVTDFGLARYAHAAANDEPPRSAANGAMRSQSADSGSARIPRRNSSASERAAIDAAYRKSLTRTPLSNTLAEPVTIAGVVVGTPAYMSPEAVAGQVVDERSDQFSFCVALYEALFGERPTWSRDGPLAALPPEGGSERSIPSWLTRIVMRGLAREPTDRWPSMTVLVDELEGTPLRRRRNRRAALAMGLATLVGSASYVQRHDKDALCDSSQYEAASVWSPVRRESLAASFARAHAETTFDVVATAIDAYQRAWVDARVDTCLATHVRREQSEALLDRSVACLEQRRSDLAATIEVLEEDTAGVLEHAIDMVSKLRRVENCRDQAYLAAAVAPPDDPEVRANVQAQRERLSRAGALRAVGKIGAAIDLANDVLSQAGELDYTPLAVDAQLQAGLAASDAGDRARARPWLSAAYFAGLRQGQFSQAAIAASRLVFVFAILDQQSERALDWAGNAEALLAHAGSDPLLIQEVYNHMGIAFTQAGRYDDGERYMRQALDMALSVHGPRHLQIALLYNNLCYVLWTAGEHEEAFDYFVDALDLQLSLVPPDSPALVRMFSNATTAFTDMGQADEALEFGLRGIELARADGQRDYHAAALHSSVARSLLELDRAHEALEHAQQAIKLYERHGASDVDQSGAYNMLASAQLALGDRAGAAATFDRTLALRGEETWSIDDGALTAFEQAKLLWDLGTRREEAVALGRRVYQRAQETKNDELAAEVRTWFALHALDHP